MSDKVGEEEASYENAEKKQEVNESPPHSKMTANPTQAFSYMMMSGAVRKDSLHCPKLTSELSLVVSGIKYLARYLLKHYSWLQV